MRHNLKCFYFDYFYANISLANAGLVVSSSINLIILDDATPKNNNIHSLTITEKEISLTNVAIAQLWKMHRVNY